MEQLNSSNIGEFTKNNKMVIIDFWAPWCMPCKMIAPILEKLEKELNELSFAKVNVDDNTDIAQQYGVMTIPTLILFKDGQELDRIVGLLPEDELKQKFIEASKR
jgi:thioredoxin 1